VIAGALAALLAAAAAVLAIRGGVEAQPWAVTLVVFAALALWSDARIGRGVSGLVLLGVVETLAFGGVDTAFHGFAQPAFFFFLALLFVTTAVEGSGTARRLAHAMLRRRRVVRPAALAWRAPAAMVASALFISSATGRTALIVPLTDRLLGGRGTDPGLRTYLTVFLAHLSPLTSRVFLSGGAGVIVAADLLATAGYHFTWWSWFGWIGIPTLAAVVLTSGAHWAWLRPKGLDGSNLDDEPLNRRDRLLLGAIVAMVLLWLVGPRFAIGPATGAIMGMGLTALVLGDPRAHLKAMNWDLILFVGATLSLAHVIEASGTAAWAGVAIAGLAAPLDSSPLLLPALLGVFVLLRLPLHNGISYSAIVLPVALAMGQVGTLDPLAVAFVVIVAASITFLPVQATPAMLSHSRQPASVGAYVTSGLITFGSVFVVVQFLIGPYWRLLGR